VHAGGPISLSVITYHMVCDGAAGRSGQDI